MAKEGLRGFQQLVGGTLWYLGEGDLCQTPGSTGTRVTAVVAVVVEDGCHQQVSSLALACWACGA